MRMGRGRELPYLTMPIPLKTSSGSNSRLIENNLMTLFLTTSSWSMWKTFLTLGHILNSTNSSLPRIKKGPYTSTDPDYLGSSYNLLIEWETGEMAWESLSNIISHDPYSCAVYAKNLIWLTHQDGSN